MEKKITCIECPRGCELHVVVEDDKAIEVREHSCPKGECYGRNEAENPTRVLTSSVCAKGLNVNMIPVRTDKPIPKDMLRAAMERIHVMCVSRPVKVGDVVAKKFMGLKVNLVATRSAKSYKK